MSTYILVHGSWHGAWCWEEVIKRLHAGARGVIAPDLPGMGRDAAPMASLTLDLWAGYIAAIARAQAEQVILVGHSRGGAVISQAAEYAFNHIAALVYLSGTLLTSGACVFDLGAEAGMDPQLAAAIIPSTDGLTLTLRRDVIGPFFYNATAPALVERAEHMIGPEPIAPNGAPLQLTESRFGRVPRFYIECLRDRVFPLVVQRAMCSRLPCRRVIQLDSDHSAFYSAPDDLTEALESIRETIGAASSHP